MAVDETDKEILEILQENGRMSYREISERVGVTPPTVKSRIDDMADEGIIEGFTVKLDEEKLIERPLLKIMFAAKTRPSAIDKVIEELKEKGGVRSLLKTADSKVLARFNGTNEDLRRFLDDLPDEVNHARALLVTDEVSQNGVA